MKSDRLGIQLSKSEVTALTEFTANAEDAPEFSGVRFVVTTETVRAYATDGHRAVEAIGEADGDVPNCGQWDVQSTFLKTAARLLEGKQMLRIAFAGGRLESANVEDEGKEVSTLTADEDVVSAQLSLPDVERLLWTQVQARAGATTSEPRVSYAAAYLAALDKIAKAADTNYVTMWASPTEEAPTFFTCDSTERGTRWTVLIAPARLDQGEELKRPEPSKPMDPPAPLKLETPAKPTKKKPAKKAKAKRKGQAK